AQPRVAVLRCTEATDGAPLGAGIRRCHSEEARSRERVWRGPRLEEQRESPTCVMAVRCHRETDAEAIASRRDPVMLPGGHGGKRWRPSFWWTTRRSPVRCTATT